DDTPENAGKVWHYSGEYDPLILKASSLFGVDSSLVRAVIAVESAFNRYARSHKGARGLMQLMPDTGRRYGVSNAYDPWQNIRAGTAHLRDLMDEFDDVNLVLAAYNAGATPVRRYGAIPPYAETRNYVRKVLAIYGVGSRIQIVRGDRTYSITEPGGKTQVIVATGSAPSAGDGSVRTGSPLADLARRSAVARGLAASPPPAAPVPAFLGPTSPIPASVTAELVYYRFVDPDGTVHITRLRPETYPYDVLSP
ncbi:MAG TPA: lytic transglycosylase domain-containing protein, partial [Vicinamibacteria bacterium]|nr:lytic transglycosylase domain-containing protein [Vicinamibacteria bacterium]